MLLLANDVDMKSVRFYNKSFGSIVNLLTNEFLFQVIKILLPHPFKTDCIDYRSLWKARGGHGPTNLKVIV